MLQGTEAISRCTASVKFHVRVCSETVEKGLKILREIQLDSDKALSTIICSCGRYYTCGGTGMGV